MIRLENAAIVFQGHPLFANVNWQITEDSRVGLIGVNGSGKSTLLKIIANQIEIDKGVVVRAKNFSVGYLPQELQNSSSRNVFEEALSGCGTARELQLQLEDVAKAMHEADPSTEEYAELVHEHGRLQHTFESLDGFSVESKTAQVLQGLAVPSEWWQRPMNQLSGGWQMRVLLAKLILSAPSLLLLDEPTNHLDVESIVWLSSFLRSYEGGLVLISHDRYFLDENIREVVEIWNGKLHSYQGNYSFYVTEKQNRLALLENAYRNQQEEIARIQQFIDRFRYKATKAKQVQSRVKMLEKIERIELPQNTDQIRLRLPAAPRSGRVVLESKNLSHAYGEKTVFSNLHMKLERGEKTALVGVNGAGKTTLLKILADQMPPSEGEVHYGHNVSIAYYAQIVADQFEPVNSVLDEMMRAGTDHDETQLRTILGSFLFSGDDVYKKVSMLSGGEKSRLALAKILLKSANLLLLDEPTNHLDLTSKEILLRALQEYEGTILFIAHDRYFMDQLAQKVLELKDGVLTTYLGNYSEYLQKAQPSDETVTEDSTVARQSTFHKSKDQRKEEAELRSRQAQYRKEVLQPLQETEVLIEHTEQEVRELERILADDQTYTDKNRFHEHIRKYQELKEALVKYYEKWEQLQKLVGSVGVPPA